jgi:hypothetical protein
VSVLIAIGAGIAGIALGLFIDNRFILGRRFERADLARIEAENKCAVYEEYIIRPRDMDKSEVFDSIRRYWMSEWYGIGRAFWHIEVKCNKCLRKIRIPFIPTNKAFSTDFVYDHESCGGKTKIKFSWSGIPKPIVEQDLDIPEIVDEKG